MDAIRVGYVSSVEKASGMVSVTYPGEDQATTDFLPFLSPGNEYCPPKIDDMVLVLYHSGGTQGICLGTFWNRENLPDYVEGVQKTYAEDSYIRYDPEQDSIIIRAKEITLQCGDQSVSVLDLMGR